MDGFRFDLASVLSRDEDGRPVPRPPVIWDIETDPILAGTKLIAEAWDAAGLYQVGSFAGDRWVEWNGRFRDDVRSFVKGDPGKVWAIAERLLASPDIYARLDREPEKTINFVTCHDGFTLNDAVSYDQKHNEANGESNRDGNDQNLSWNCGVEGPTDDPAIESLRNRQVKNLLAIELLAVGVPMVTMGDEVRRTQLGNNNAYCQDSELSWLDWALVDRNAGILRFCQGLIAGRRRASELFGAPTDVTLAELLRRSRVDWHGTRLGRPDMGETSRSIALALWGEHVVLHLILNAYWEGLDFEIPPLEAGMAGWRRIVDTSLESPDDILAAADAPAVDSQRLSSGAAVRRRARLGQNAGRTRSGGTGMTTTDGAPTGAGAERARMADPGRLEEGLDTASPWYQWGPYVSERAWGSVREDYSADGNAWASFPHDHARSRAYRWNEDGMAGLSDVFGRLNLGLALWNGRDPILKERMFGLTNSEGNHGEDVKEYWWYLDATPSSSWLKWRYHYPHAAFPYEDLVAENGRRSRLEPEYELLDTGIFDDDRYWIVEVDYAKADPTDILARITVRNAGPDPATIHVLPTLWFRNEWSWDASIPRPSLSAEGGAGPIHASHPALGDYELHLGAGPDGAAPELLFCENETNAPRVYGAEATTAWPKDGINDHVVSGAATVNPAQTGTKAAAWYRLTVAPGATAEIRLRLRSRPPAAPGEPRETSLLDESFATIMALRKAEADEFYAGLSRRAPPTTRRWSCARRSPGCSGASSSTPTTSAAGSTATRPARRRRRSG